ncbi:MAG: FecR family protein [Nevskiales bacterium]
METSHQQISVIPAKAGIQLFTILALCLLALDANAAGRVLFVKGGAQLEREGRVQPLLKGAKVEAGDLLITGEEGRVQLLMDDGDRMALRPNTRLRIDEFTAPASAAQPGTGRAFYSLLRGGFRALTRSLGARDMNSYRVSTPVATLGIRGTHYTLRLCNNDCGGSNNGLYTGVTDGAVSLENNGGQQTVGKNQFGYVPDSNNKPKLLIGPPDPLKDDTNGGGPGDGSTDSISNRSSPAEGEMDPPSGSIYTPEQSIQGTDPFGRPTDLTPGQVPEPPPPPPPPPPQIDQ